MKARATTSLKVFSRPKLPVGHSRYAAKLPDIHDFPIVKPAKAHMINTKKYYPSGPQLHQTRLKYPYLSSETLAEEISKQALTQKTSNILKELSQALGNVSTGKLARPVTGMVVKISGVTNVEKSFKTVITYHRGSLQNGVREQTVRTRNGAMGSRTTNVTLVSAAYPF